MNIYLLIFFLIIISISLSQKQDSLFESSIKKKTNSLPSPILFSEVYVEFGQNIGKHVRKRLKIHLSNIEKTKVFVMKNGLGSSQDNNKEFILNNALNISQSINDIDNSVSAKNILLLSFGNASLSSYIYNNFQHSGSNIFDYIKDEGYSYVISQLNSINKNVFFGVCDGKPLSLDRHQNITFPKKNIVYGSLVGSYSLLEEFGLNFLHPLQPNYPNILHTSNLVRQNNILLPTIKTNSSFNNEKLENFNNDNTLFLLKIDNPHWPDRSFHIHTQHPLELTEVLQGHDIPQFGPFGPHCKSNTKRKYLLKKTEKHFEFSSNSNIPYCERWEDMLIDVDYLYEWCISNKLNKIEWLLLGNYKWGDEVESRTERLKKLTNLAHQYSLMVGIDVPIGNQQQHGLYMVNVRLPFNEQVEQIKTKVDWLFNIGFDFMTTESGLSEFTHPECSLMIDLLSEFSKYVNITWGREAGVKVHCSTGQKCENYPDPRTGDPINFNFLPTYVHPSLGIFPHTVQMYALDDPTGGTYGNQNFQYIEDYLVFEAKKGERSVSYYGETSYWVNVDTDVPLFIPLYGQRRLRDLRRIAHRERIESFHMDGQMNFDSGWEWGYWLNDVITARASWDPMITEDSTEIFYQCSGLYEKDIIVDQETADDYYFEDKSCDNEIELISKDCLNEDLQLTSQVEQSELSIHSNKTFKESCNPHQDEYQAFSKALEPFTRIFGPTLGQEVNNFLVDFTKAQSDILIKGIINNNPSINLKKLSGIAYLIGTDTWVDLPRKFGLAFTQPDKVHLTEVNDPLWPHVIELLFEMDQIFSNLSQNFEKIWKKAHNEFNQGNSIYLNSQSMSLLDELYDCVTILYLRTRLVFLLYTSQDLHLHPSYSVLINHPSDLSFHQKDIESSIRNHNYRLELLKESRSIIEKAQEIVNRREKNYRVHPDRVAAWRENPTVYRYGYLWSVSSLYYWWRDQSIAEYSAKLVEKKYPLLEKKKYSINNENCIQYSNESYCIEVGNPDNSSFLYNFKKLIHKFFPFSSVISLIFTPHSPHSVCYLNRMDSTEVAIGFGRKHLETLRNLIRKYLPVWATSSWLGSVNCLSPPLNEYKFPRDLNI